MSGVPTSESAAPGSRSVLLLAHGSPDSPREVPKFLMRVTGGRALPPGVVEEVERRSLVAFRLQAEGGGQP